MFRFSRVYPFLPRENWVKWKWHNGKRWKLRSVTVFPQSEACAAAAADGGRAT